jgi:hypothetical protein
MYFKKYKKESKIDILDIFKDCNIENLTFSNKDFSVFGEISERETNIRFRKDLFEYLCDNLPLDNSNLHRLIIARLESI